MKAHALAILLTAILFATVLAAQLPDVSWTCPMHPDVLDAGKGTCGICGMDLEPVRIAAVYTCPVHAVIEQADAGKCRICARELVRKTAALTFTCADNREINQIQPGTCADGSAMVPRYTQRAHGDHNPKHGGIFFMAPDSWHHLEGAYPAAGRVRVYLYDDYARPLSRDAARKVRGRVVVKETFDPKTGLTRELAAAPLVLARDGDFFEARIEPLALPARLTAKVAFADGDKESRFDFTFPEYSKDLPVPAPSSSSTARAPAAPRPTAAPDALLAALKARQAEVASLVSDGQLAAIYLPALQAKDAALEIQARYSAAPLDHSALEAGVRQIVIAAYELDSYGDMGDGQKVGEAFSAFNAAVSAIDSLITGPPP